MAVAILDGSAVGLDLEMLRRFTEWPQVAADVLTATALRAVREAPASDRFEVFLRHWVAKEAYVKALGRGIDDGFRDIDVRQTGPTAFRGPGRWQVRLLPVWPDAYVALATLGHVKLEIRQVPDIRCGDGWITMRSQLGLTRAYI
jgi:phosphopantetheinyl transferase